MTVHRIILVPTDFSESAERALLEALDLAAAHGATIELVHVWKRSEYTAPDSAASREREQELLDQLEETLEKHRERGVPMRAHLRVGVPSEEIVAAAGELGADLVVVAEHPHGLLHQLVHESVAEKVLDAAPCAVLRLRHEEAD